MTTSTTHGIGDTQPQLLNNRHYWLGYGHVDRLDDPDVTTYRSGVAHPLLNGVLRVARGGFARARSLAASFGDLPSTWWIGEDSYPGLADDLVAAGGTQVATMPVMAARVDDVLDQPAVPGLTIETVPAAGLREWVSAYAPSMGVAPDQEEASLAMEARHADTPAHLVRFAGRVDGEVVGTSALLDRAGVGGIYLVSTAEAHRRRGIGAALTAAAVAEAGRRHLPMVTLQASRLGEPVYRRMGFTTVAHYRLFTL
jgi:GNAT superfamily N-acetyltransferase